MLDISPRECRKSIAKGHTTDRSDAASSYETRAPHEETRQHPSLPPTSSERRERRRRRRRRRKKRDPRCSLSFSNSQRSTLRRMFDLPVTASAPRHALPIGGRFRAEEDKPRARTARSCLRFILASCWPLLLAVVAVLDFYQFSFPLSSNPVLRIDHSPIRGCELHGARRGRRAGEGQHEWERRGGRRGTTPAPAELPTRCRRGRPKRRASQKPVFASLVRVAARARELASCASGLKERKNWRSSLR